MDPDVPLNALGERRIIRELLAPRYSPMNGAFGDDCAVLAEEVPAGWGLVATTDPCPEPVVQLLGWDDLYYAGWLAATINLSDLGASGATPLGIVASYDLPGGMAVGDFLRLLDGVDDACAGAGTRVVGGNLRDRERMEVCITAIGGVPAGLRLGRSGARRGDAVVVIGDLGAFWGGVLACQRELDVSQVSRDWLLERMLTPRAKTSCGGALAEKRLVTAAMDSSDGLIPTLRELCRANGAGITLDPETWRLDQPVREVADMLEIEPRRLALGFGDWHLVVCADPGAVEAIVATAGALGHAACAIGEVDDTGGVHWGESSGRGEALSPENERFSATSWSPSSLPAVVDQLLYGPIG